jgi:hypothetical protein
MTTNGNRPERKKVRAENPTGACGYIDHMTIDELRERALGDEFDATCPGCGMFHLTRDEIEQLNRQKFTESEDFADMRNEAEESV